MESNDEISLFTDGVIKTITDNHRSEIKKLNEHHEKKVEDINTRHLSSIQHKRLELENFYKRELDKVNNENIFLKNENVLLKNENEILKNENKNLKDCLQSCRTEIKNNKAFIKDLRRELDRTTSKGKQAWDIFRERSPKEYENYIRDIKITNRTDNIWSTKLIGNYPKISNSVSDFIPDSKSYIQFGSF